MELSALPTLDILRRAKRRLQITIEARYHFNKNKQHDRNIFDEHFDRIYHIHCRKTAGTSVNKMFLALAVGHFDKAVDQLYERLAHPPYNVIHDGWRFSAWSAQTLRYPQFDFGFSHIPLARLKLPPRTLRFTVLRDPVARVCSLYDMLTDCVANNSTNPDHRSQMEWVKNGFMGFLERAPRTEICGQLAMFSPSLSVDEGLQRLSEIEMVIPLPQLREGMEQLGQRFGYTLKVPHLRRGTKKYQPTANEYAALRELVAHEFAFFEAGCALSNSIAQIAKGGDA